MSTTDEHIELLKGIRERATRAHFLDVSIPTAALGLMLCMIERLESEKEEAVQKLAEWEKGPAQIAASLKANKYDLQKARENDPRFPFDDHECKPLTLPELNSLMTILVAPSKDTDKMEAFLQYLPEIVTTLAKMRDLMEKETV